MFRTVEYLLRPKSIALLGASDSSRGGWVQEIYDNLEFSGFPAKLYLVNPKRRELWGRPVYPNFAAIPEPVDLALTIIPTVAVVDTLAEAAASGLKCALIYAAQFGEGGDAEGQKRAQALLALSDKHGLRISGPNCMGSIALREKLLLYPAKRVRGLQPGPVGVVFQSGGTFQFWLQQAALRGLDFSYAISSGNELDLDLADYINFLVDDEHTKMIVCLVEGMRRPQAFMAAAEKALAAGKPILIVKVGRSERGKAAAVSHTGAIAADDQVFDAVCRKYGVIRCPSLDDLMETALAFSQGRLPNGNRIAMACYSGGAKGLVLDYAADEGAEMAPLTAETRAKLPGMIDAGLRRGKSVGCRPDGRRAGRKVRRDLQGRLRRSDGRSRHRAGPDAGQPRRSLQSGAAAQRVRFDRQAGAGVRAHRAERLRDQPQVPERNRRSVHPRPARNRACVAGAGPLRGGAAARRHLDAGTARARRKPGWRGLRHAARVAWTDGAKKRAGQELRTKRPRTPPASAFRSQ